MKTPRKNLNFNGAELDQKKHQAVDAEDELD